MRLLQEPTEQTLRVEVFDKDIFKPQMLLVGSVQQVRGVRVVRSVQGSKRTCVRARVWGGHMNAC